MLLCMRKLDDRQEARVTMAQRLARCVLRGISAKPCHPTPADSLRAQAHASTTQAVGKHHHTTMTVARDSAAETLDLLQQRLQRVQFLLYGDTADAAHTGSQEPSQPTPQTPSQSVASRLQALQKSLNSILSDSQNAQHVVDLRASFNLSSFSHSC